MMTDDPSNAVAGGGGSILSRGRRQLLFSTLIVALLGAAVEIGLWVAIMLDPSRIGVALVAHGGVVLAMALWARFLRRARKPSRIYLLFVTTTAALGAAGTVGTLLCVMLLWFFARRATPFEIWYASLSPETQVDPTHALYEQIVGRGAKPDLGSVAPFAGVIATGSTEQKQTVLALIADNFRPSFATALRAALNDAEPVVRVQAATTSARIENQFLEHSMLFEDRRASRPDDIQVVLELARHYDDYANTGLLDASRANRARRQALELYERADRLQPGDSDVAKAIGRILLRLDRSDDAVARLGPLVRAGNAPMEVLAWYIESLYRLRRLTAVRQTCERFKNNLSDAAELSCDFRQAVVVWVAAGSLENNRLERRRARGRRLSYS
jgi:hypothetical protein